MHNPYLTLGFKPRVAAASPTHTTELSPDPVTGQGNNDKLGFLLLGYKIYTDKCLGYSAVNNVKKRVDWAGVTQWPGSLVPGKQKSEGELTGQKNSGESTEHVPSTVQ